MRPTRRPIPRPERSAIAWGAAALAVSVAAPAHEIDRSIADIVDRVRPSVVSISVTRSRGSEFAWGPERGGTVRQTPSTRGFGSGIVLDVDGRILTNRHVVNEAVTIQVGFTDGRRVNGRLVGQDSETDLAVLQIDRADLSNDHIALLGDSDSLRVGDWVIAFGSPFGYHHTVSVGVVSATGRQLDSIERDHPTPFHSFIQTDAAINPGNSGGPLIDTSGRVVGINTAYNPGAPGIAFAIPINLAARVAGKLTTAGRVSRGYLGIVPQDLDAELAEALSLAEISGLLIADVRPDGPEDQAGLSQGDVLVKLGARSIATVADYGAVLAELSPGEQQRPSESHRPTDPTSLECPAKTRSEQETGWVSKSPTAGAWRRGGSGRQKLDRASSSATSPRGAQRTKRN